MYYNTTAQVGDLLRDYKAKTINQNDAIAVYMRNRGALSPSQVCLQLFNNTIPVTSVRRAMTSLTNDGLLKRLDQTIEGPYGRPEHLWKYIA